MQIERIPLSIDSDAEIYKSTSNYFTGGAGFGLPSIVS